LGIARTSIQEAEVGVRTSKAGNGALIGFVAGAAIGGGLGAAACQSSSSGFIPGPGACAAIGGLVLGLVGAGIGAAIGSPGGHEEHWEPVALGHSRR